MTAGLYLRRFWRSVHIVHDATSRAARIPRSHNYPGFPDGISGHDLLERLARQAAHYGVHVTRTLVDRVQRDGEDFVVQAGDAAWRAPRLLLATGMVDKTPEIRNLREAIARGAIRLCSICDGYDVMDRDIAVFGDGEMALPHARFMRTWSARVTLLATQATPRADEALRAAAREAGVVLVEDPVARIEMGEDGRAHVQTQGGQALAFDTVYPVIGCRNRSELAQCLGARCAEAGDIVVDSHMRSSVPGLYAAGDVVAALNQVSVAVGHAAIAATHIHNSLPPAFRA